MVEADLNKENEEEVNFDDPKGFEDDIPEKGFSILFGFKDV